MHNHARRDPPAQLPRSDSDLAREAAKGDEESFRELMSRWSDSVFATALRLTRDHEEASEVLQDVLWRVYRGLETYDPDRPFAPWLARVTRNVIYDRNRSRWRKRAGMRDVPLEQVRPSEIPAVSPGIEEALATRQTAVRIRALIADLPEKQAKVLWMHDVAGIPAANLAGLFGLTVPGIKSRIHQGRLTVRRLLAERR